MLPRSPEHGARGIRLACVGVQGQTVGTMRHVPSIDALELLSAVAHHGSISAAARETGCTQQSASARIRSLERTLGLELVTRSPHGVALTASGRRVLTWTDDLLAAAERFRAGVERLRGESTRALVVAASQTVAAHMLPAWLLALRAAQLEDGREPTSVRLVTANSDETAELVRTGKADLGFVESPDIPDDLSSSTVADDVLVLVTAPSHPWTDHGSVSLDDVADTALIAREDGSGTRRAWESAVRKRLGRTPVAPAMVLSTSAAIRSAVAEGIAPAVLSDLVVADDVRLARLRRIAIAGPAISRPITALWRGTPRDLAPTSRDLLEAAVRRGIPT
ncbi:LysR family transcriptional regulator [Microbacterium sp. JZ37]|nr:LysR family transcriptional regulator [Microbacterium sp. JZ37]